MPTATANEKRSVEANRHHRRHAAAAVHHHGGHQYLHDHHGKVRPVDESQLLERAVGDLVSATIDGQLVSWTNEYAGPGVATAAPVAEAVDDVNASALSTDATKTVDLTSQSSALSSTAIISISSSITSTATAKSQSWTRQAYFNAATGTAEGLTFLNHFGGTNGIPGTSAGGPALGTLTRYMRTVQNAKTRYSFGASLSYASSDGQSGAASPQVLSNAMIEDDTEMVIMTNRSCTNGGCAYTRPGGVAYRKSCLSFYISPVSTAEDGDDQMVLQARRRSFFSSFRCLIQILRLSTAICPLFGF